MTTHRFHFLASQMAENDRAVSPETNAEYGAAEAEGPSSGAPMAKRRRTSILNVMRRQSKSMAASGISFEDQGNEMHLLVFAYFFNVLFLRA